MDYKIGDKIKITKVFSDSEKTQVFFEGDVGIIIENKDYAGDYRVDFNNQANPKVIDDGIWFVGENSINPLVNSFYEIGEKILVSSDGLEYVERRFHSHEDQGVWCPFNSNGRALRFWPFHKKIEVKVEKKEEKLPRFHEAQVGDLVYNRLCGHGVIQNIYKEDNYQLKIYTEITESESSTLEGLYRLGDIEPTWFYVNPNDPNDKYLEERPNEAYERKKSVGVQSSIEWVRENLSNRANEWLKFSDIIVSHIESYTVPQYGDTPGDQAEEWTAEDCFKSIERYLNRRNSQSREGQDLLDIKKMAHYLCLAYFKKEVGK